MDKHAEYHYSDGVEKQTKAQLRDEYRDVLLAHEMREHMLAGRPYFPERAVRERLANMEKNAPIGFFDDFRRWAETNGWQSRAGNITESDAGTLAVGEVNS